jgi:hypothetical protein
MCTPIACATCRARKVKCDERPNGCLNCERLQLDCLQNGVATGVKRPAASVDTITGIKRKRTFRSCVPCRDSKVKCSGERPNCARCQQRRTTCVYDAEQNEPAWVQSIATPTGHTPDGSALASVQSPPIPQIPQNGLALPVEVDIPGCPPTLTW